MSSFLVLCSLLFVLGFIIKIGAHSLVHTLDQETLLFSILECICPAIILLIVSLYIRRRSKTIEEKQILQKFLHTIEQRHGSGHNHNSK